MIKKQLSLLLCGILLLPLLLSSPAMAAEGMDVSVFQGQVDFSAARQGGVEIVYIRASYGRTGVDARFYQNCAAAQAAGIPFGFTTTCRALHQRPPGRRRSTLPALSGTNPTPAAPLWTLWATGN